MVRKYRLNRLFIFKTQVFFVWLYFYSIGSIYSQQLEINRIQLSEDEVIVHYDLTDSVVGRFYTVRLYSSHDDYLNPLVQVSGDVGLEIKPGRSKTIHWKPFEETNTRMDRSLSLEVRATVFIPFINLERFEELKAIKRGREYMITWSGGRPENVLAFELFRGNDKVFTIANIANNGHYNLIIPTYIKPGSNYRFKVSDTRNEEEVVYTAPFTIKRKYPLAYRAVPIAMLSILSAVVLQEPDTDDLISDPPITFNR